MEPSDTTARPRPLKGEVGPQSLPFLFRQAFRNPRSLTEKFRRVRDTFRDWPFYWTTRVLDAPKERIYRIRDGPRIWLRTGTVDFYIADEVFRQRVYLPTDDWISRDSVVLDIGAHVGTFTLMASRIASQGRVVALEPHPNNVALLRRNVLLNGCRNVEILPWAAGARTQLRPLFLSQYNLGGHSFYVPGLDSVQVPCVGVADLLVRLHLPVIDLVKIDCEGAEHEILESFPEEGLVSVRRMSIEFHDLSSDRNGETLRRLLRRAGFQVEVISDRSVLHASREPFTARG